MTGTTGQYNVNVNIHDIIRQFRYYKKEWKQRNDEKKLRKELPEIDEFDLIICDEVHRTAGVTLKGEDELALYIDIQCNIKIEFI